MLHPTTSFPSVYRKLLGDLLNKDYAYREFNERTKTNVAVIPGAQAFKLDLSDGKLPVCGLRKLRPRTAAAEIAWFMKGTQDVTWLEERDCRIWSAFAKNGQVENAYGYRWRKHFGRDQIGDAVKTLQKNPTCRQVYIGAWDPGADGLGQKATNFPCPVGFSISITDMKLHCTMMLRSSDVFVGLPYDVMGQAMLMAILANWIDPRGRITLGTLSVVLAHAHLYDKHWEMAKQCITRETVRTTVPLLAPSMDRPDWDLFIATYDQHARKARWPDFDPRPELIL